MQNNIVELETTKEGVLAATKRSWMRFQHAIADVEDEELEEEAIEGTWTLADIMAHIMFWEQKLIGWLQEAEAERRPSLYNESLDDAQIDTLNQANFEHHRGRSLQDVMIEAAEVHRHLMDALCCLPEEANDPRMEVWEGGQIPWQLVAETTYEHYEEHIQAIRNFLSARK
jgi:hypothetical protein